MGGEKIVLARQAVAHALQLVKPADRFSVVAFDDVVDVVVGSTPGSAEAKRLALERLAQIDARGSTNLVGGWEAGCKEAAAHRSGDAVGRCLLVTDGQANVGESDPEQLGRLAAAMRQRGVATSTFGNRRGLRRAHAPAHGRRRAGPLLLPRDAPESKRRHFASYAVQHQRTAEGKTRKRV